MKSITTFEIFLPALLAGLLVAGLPVAAQESGGGEPQGFESQGSESQRQPLREEPRGRQMPGSKALSYADAAPAEQTGGGGMEDLLLRTAPERAAQPPVAETLDLGGPGPIDPRQRLRVAELQETFLTVVLRITGDGTSEVLSATEMQGPAPLSTEVLSDFAYEVADGGELLAAQSLSGDPFEAHSFGSGPGDPPEHFFERLEETTVVIRVPGRSLDSELGDLSIRMLRLGAGPPLEAMTTAAVSDLASADRLETLAEVAGAELARQIRDKGTRLPLQ
ncbi:MAG: hypothetical protein V3T72_15100 [Thermoanaerobaculia bacterium]